MAYKVIRQPEFTTNLTKLRIIPPHLHDHYLSGVIWALEHDPRVGKQVGRNVWMIKVIWAPVVPKIFYAINDTQKTVYLLDITP